MSDPFETLRHLDEGAFGGALPAAEVRRRGERMRRRHAAFQAVGTAAAVAVVVGGGLLLAGTRPGATPTPGPAGPSPSASTSASAGSKSKVPADFPLDAGYEQDNPTTSEDLQTPWALDPCLDHPRTAAEEGRTDFRQVEVLAAGTHRVRQVAAYSGAAAARAAFDELAVAVRRCATTSHPDDGMIERWTAQDAVLPGADASLTTVAHVTRDGKATNEGIHVLVAHVGSAVVLLKADGQLAGSESSLDAVDFEQRAYAERMVAAMCVFTVEGCGGRPVVTATGYGNLVLGMPAKQVEASAQVKDLDRGTGGSCRAGRLVDGGGFYLSRRLGLATIWLGGIMQTDKGIMIGSTLRQVQQAYPLGEWNTHHYWESPVGAPGGVRVMQFGFDGANTVSGAMLTRSDQDCVG